MATGLGHPSACSDLGAEPAKVRRCPCICYCRRPLLMHAMLCWCVLSSGAVVASACTCGWFPSIPTLFVAWLAARLRGAKFIIDWHNFGYTILSMSLGQRGFIGRSVVKVRAKRQLVTPTSPVACLARCLCGCPRSLPCFRCVNVQFFSFHSRPRALSCLPSVLDVLRAVFRSAS